MSPVDETRRLADAETAWRDAHAATQRAEEALRDAELREAQLFADFTELVNPRWGHFMRRLIERQEQIRREEAGAVSSNIDT
ncbi:MAG: hypothetical protein ACREC4_00860 [Methylocella sp.]